MKVAAILATVWLILIWGGTIISFIHPESRSAAFVWLLILSLPSSLLAPNFNVSPVADILIMAVLGAEQLVYKRSCQVENTSGDSGT